MTTRICAETDTTCRHHCAGGPCLLAPSVNPWHPMADPVDLKHLGKLLEELGECTAAASRCLIQGMDEREPTTGEVNRDWLAKEMSDVAAQFALIYERFGVGVDRARADRKIEQCRAWHRMA